MRFWTLLLILSPLSAFAQNQSFYFGNDLSYVNQMEDCGAVYKEEGLSKDPYTIFADHGTNLVRVRLWKDPSWWQGELNQPDGVKSYYNDLDDVKKTIKRARENGMEVMLGIHYSDFWADPGRQLIPMAWIDVAYDLKSLKDSVYNYTVKVLTELDQEGLMPNIVKIGNETTAGILSQIPEEDGWEVKETVSTDWGRHAELFNTAIRAVRDASTSTGIVPKIALHMAGGLEGLYWNMENRFLANGITDFDIFGFSYYYAWNGASIAQLQETVSSLATSFSDYEIMAVETGYPWTDQNFDQLGNIVTDMDPEYNPLSPERQLEYMIDYTRAVMKGGGTGVVFWEPAWVTTPCRTPWGTGSSHDHLAFFDPENTNFISNGGGRWTEPQWYAQDLVKVSFKADMHDQDVSKGVYIMGDFTDHPVQMLQIDEDIYYHYELLNKQSSGYYYFLNGSNLEDKESVPADCSNGQGYRPYSIANEDIELGYFWSSCDEPDPDRHLFHNYTFRVDMTGHDLGFGAFITGSFTGDPWEIIPMQHEINKIYTYRITLKEGREGAFYFLNGNDWDYREIVPDECADWWGQDRGYRVHDQDETYFVAFGSCDEERNILNALGRKELHVFPNPSSDLINIQASHQFISLRIMDITGQSVMDHQLSSPSDQVQIDIKDISPGIYFLEIPGNFQVIRQKIIIK